MSRSRLTLPFSREVLFFSPLQKQKSGLSWSLKYNFPCLFMFFSRSIRNEKWSLEKKKKENPTFIDEDNIPLVNLDDEEHYDERYDTPKSRVVDTSFTLPDITEAITTSFSSLYRYLDVTGDPGLADLDQFMPKKNSKTGNIELLFFDCSNFPLWPGKFTLRREKHYKTPSSIFKSS